MVWDRDNLRGRLVMRDIVPEVRRMVEDSRYYANLRAATAGLALPDATRRIVEEITALIPAPLAPQDLLVDAPGRDVV